MIIIRLLRLIVGYVDFCGEGGFPERFVNLCSMSGVPLWNLQRIGSKTYACTTVEGYLKIRQCAARSGMRVRIERKHGIPFFLHKYRRRSGLLCGLMFFLCVLAILSSMIWTIDISGNNRVTDEQLREVLYDAGLKIGMIGSKIDAPHIRFYALSNLPDVTYITINRFGSSVQVEVTERIEQPDVPADSTPCDVVSAYDGQVAVLEAYEGTKLHEVGEAVRAGEVLAGGFVELRDGSVRFRHAQAYAIIRTQLGVEATVERTRTVLCQASAGKQITLNLFGLDIPLPAKVPECSCITRRRSLKIGGVYLPLGYTVRLYRAYEEKERKPDKNELALDIAEKYLSRKISTLGGAVVCSSEFDITQSNSTVTAHGRYLSEVSAGVSRTMLIE